MATKKAKPATVKKPRAKKSLSSILDSEPRLVMPDNAAMSTALNWYNRQAQNKEQRVDWTLDYMKMVGTYSAPEMAEMKRRGKKFLGTFSALARMVVNGCIIDDKYKQLLETELRAFVKKSDEPELDEEGNLIVTKDEPAKKVAAVKKTAGNYGTMCKAVEHIDSEMDAVLNGVGSDSMYEWLSNNVKAAEVRALVDYYKPQAMEFYELWMGKDEQLNEGYSHLNKKTRKSIKEWMMQLILDLNKLGANKKVERKPRKKKPQKLENVVKRVKYQKSAPDFKLVSINPTEVVHKKVLWVFNTKYRQIGVYRSDEGFTFKGTTLQNATGVGKTLRKPQEFLDDFKGTQKSLENRYTAVKTKEATLNGRINEHTLFLKAF